MQTALGPQVRTLKRELQRSPGLRILLQTRPPHYESVLRRFRFRLSAFRFCIPMSTDLENLLARRANILAELAAMSSDSSGGKPSYSLDGQQVDHVRYRMSLYEELEAIDRRLTSLQGPVEDRGRGIT